jgi:hypothetical protein
MDWKNVKEPEASMKQSKRLVFCMSLSVPQDTSDKDHRTA